jgi:protein O-mannosyl-transferase
MSESEARSQEQSPSQEQSSFQPQSQTPLQSAESKSDGREPRLSNRLMIALVMSITMAAYIGTIKNKFVYDDRNQIVENNFIKSWRNAPSYFTGQVWQEIYPAFPGNYYRPVFLLWLLLNFKLFGLNAALWHLALALAHTAATLLVWKLARRLLKDDPAALIAALIFGLHPVHIEAVAWVSGATEPLLALMFIPSLLFYLNWRERYQTLSGDESTTASTSASTANGRGSIISAKWLAASLAMFALAMLAKETALVLPLIIFFYEWIFGERGERLRSGLKRAAPYFTLAIVYLAARGAALNGLGHQVTPLPAGVVLLTLPSVAWFYIKLLIWPSGLSAFYDTPYITSGGLSNFLLPLIAVVAVGAALGWWGWRKKEIAFASILIALPILPLLNLTVFLEGEIAHDRYLYLPSIGFSIIVAVAVRRIRFGSQQLLGQPAFQTFAVALIAVSLALMTSLQNGHWANNLLLFFRGAAVAPNNDIAKNNLANEMVERGLYDEAIKLYSEALARNPTYWRASYNLGFSYFKLGMREEAEKHLARATQINQLLADQSVHRAFTRMRLGSFDEAESEMRRAIESRPDAPGYHYALGVILQRKPDIAGALNEFKAAIVNNPEPQAAQSEIAEIEAIR